MITCGIDPGKQGAIAFISEGVRPLHIVLLKDLVGKNKKYDEALIWNAFLPFAPQRSRLEGFTAQARALCERAIRATEDDGDDDEFWAAREGMAALLSLDRSMSTETVHHTVLEEQRAMPTDGKAGIFTVGMGYGILRATLRGQNIPFQVLTPARWQKLLGLANIPKDKRKARHIQMAQDLFPGVEQLERRNPLDGVADALLMARAAWILTRQGMDE